MRIHLLRVFILLLMAALFLYVLLWLTLCSSSSLDTDNPLKSHLLDWKLTGPKDSMKQEKCPEDAVGCKYEGHCQIGTTCIMKPECNSGVCEPYFPTESIKDNADKACIDSCVAELKWDERMYYHATIEILSQRKANPSDGRPEGCLVMYRRNHNAYNEMDEDIRQEWLNATSRHVIVRVDPVPNSDTWQALCFNPCQEDDDCAPSVQVDNNKKAFVCENGACQRNRNKNSSYWTKGETKEELVIVTGTNSAYFGGLSNLAASVRYWAPNHGLVVYNLGMSSSELKTVESWSNVLEVRWKKGIPALFPPHVHKLKQYAWKPLAILESLEKYGMVFWLDAGSTLTGPLDAAQRILEQTGAFLVKGQDLDMKKRSAEATYNWFGVNKTTFLAGPSYGGGTQAWTLPSRYVDTIVRPNAECALLAECIAPATSSISNHRYDQTSLSVLAYKMQLPHHTEYVAAGRNQLSRDLDDPSFMFLWTARSTCRHYSQKGY